MDQAKSPKTGYRGWEKRRAERRSQPDRRELIRWEPEKADRRSGKDRRRLNYGDLWAKVDDRH
jgi:hypothetical protein